MTRMWCLVVLAAVIAAAVSGARQAAADVLTIYQVQYTEDAGGASPLDGQIVDCAGGIVTHKFGGRKPKITLQDPNYPDGWGGIQVKDWTVGLDLFNAVSIGDWIGLTNMEVEEYRGNTLLQYKSDNSAGCAVASTGNPLPAHRIVTEDEIAAPLEGPPEEWYVADHDAEKYEAMLLTVENVMVVAMDLGKAKDNYVLRGSTGDCWASDYMNADRGDLYHPCVGIGTCFDSVSGILEQYTKNEFDYYQLLTTGSADFVPEPASIAALLVGVLAFLRQPKRARPLR